MAYSLENFEGVYPLTSPRSIEACLLEGIDPQELRALTAKDFENKNTPKRAAQVLHENYEIRRQKKLAELNATRGKIIERQNGPATPGKTMVHSHSTPAGFGVEHDDDDGNKKQSGILEREIARMEKVKKRQKAEIEGILAHERHLVKLHKEAAEKEERDYQKMLERKKKREEKAAIAAEKKADMEMKKLELEREEEERAKELAMRDFKEQQRLAKLEEKQRKEAKKMKERREKERARKAEIRRMKTQQILKSLEEKADERMRKLEEADYKREMRNKKKREDALARARAKSEESAKRIQAAIAAGNKALEDKRKKVADKNELAAKVREEREAEKEAERLAMIERNKERNENRRELLMDVYEKEKDRIRQFERHIIENQGQLAQVRAKEAEYRAFMKAKKDSRIQAKIENVARRQRKEEFRRLQTLQKLEAEEQRQKELQETRRKLKLQRKAEEMESMKRKTNLKKSMDYIRATAKWNLIEFLDDKGNINRRRRRRRKKDDEEENGEEGKDKGAETM